MGRHLFRTLSPPARPPNRGQNDCLGNGLRLSCQRGSVHLLAHARAFSATSCAAGGRFRTQGVACSHREGGVALVHPGAPAGIAGGGTGRPVDNFFELTPAISTLVFIDGHGCCPHWLRQKILAERAGFEPALEFPLNTLSKRAPSATRPSLPVHLRPIVMKSGGGVQRDSHSESVAARGSPRRVKPQQRTGNGLRLQAAKVLHLSQNPDGIAHRNGSSRFDPREHSPASIQLPLQSGPDLIHAAARQAGLGNPQPHL